MKVVWDVLWLLAFAGIGLGLGYLCIAAGIFD
jgi:hypothetical protein